MGDRFLEVLQEFYERWPIKSEGPFHHAITRRAFNLENGTPGQPDHEPLEWLGDRILGAVVAAELWERFPHASPGQYDLMRDALTSEKPLADLARELELLDFIKMGAGERQQRQVETDKSLSSHMEAVFGAAFQIGGWEGASALIQRVFEARWPTALPQEGARSVNQESDSEVLTRLNLHVQQQWRTSLSKDAWVVEQVGGSSNAPVHRATVMLPDGQRFDGKALPGKKSAAKASAARRALDALENPINIYMAFLTGGGEE